MAKFQVSFTVDVDVEIDDDILAEAYEVDNGRNQYGFFDEEEVVQHLAFNAVVNGESDGHRLDGFADTTPEQLTMTVDRLSNYSFVTKVEKE